MKLSKALLGLALGANLALSPVVVQAEQSGTSTTNVEIQTGWVLDGTDRYYYVDQLIVKGWKFIDNNWYYFDLQTGKMHVGWLLEGGKWYHLSKEGKMTIGWLLDGQKWYHLSVSGVMSTGWIQDQGKWYYLTADGAMQTGWLLYGNKWYYLNQSGAMSTGWIQTGSNWYYLSESGQMQTGWLYDQYRWYYLFGDGRLAINTTVGGNIVGRSGAWIPNWVNPKQVYSYEQMTYDIARIAETYPDLVQTQVIGQSVDGRNLYAVKLGKGNKEIFLNGSHHAREHMTTNVLMEMLDEYARSYADGTVYAGFDTRTLLNQVSMWFVPMVNPDGVTLVQRGHTSAKNPSYVLWLNNNSTDFSSWKANIRGVDLNRQYPAGWEAITGPTTPAPANFKGYQPISEPEVAALMNFTKVHSFLSATSYHSSGEILYWYYKQSGTNYTRDYQIAQGYSNLTGYPLVAPVANPGGGGYKDWFIQETGMPGFTPEISPYTNNQPVPLENFDRIWSQNAAAGLYLAKEAANR